MRNVDPRPYRRDGDPEGPPYIPLPLTIRRLALYNCKAFTGETFLPKFDHTLDFSKLTDVSETFDLLFGVRADRCRSSFERLGIMRHSRRSSPVYWIALREATCLQLHWTYWISQSGHGRTPMSSP